MTTTFDVGNVRVCREKIGNQRTLQRLFAGMGAHGVEGCGVNSPLPLHDAYMNPFLGAIHRAYECHFPLVLSPDDVWTVLAQGFATHVNVDAENLRGRFVGHEGKVDLVVDLPFTKGAPDAPWDVALAQFSNAIAENIGPKQRDLVVSNFSTTGVVERAASEIVLMGAMSKFFGYIGRTLCGIPEITLLGTTEDWQSVKDRASSLGEYNLTWWTKDLLPVLDQFVRASKGDVDQSFWRSIYKLDDNSGGPYISGWVVDLFPYLISRSYGPDRTIVETMAPNGYLEGGSRSRRHGPTTSMFPMGVTKVPWKWDYLGTWFEMEFLGGFVGITQDPETYAVRPALAWAVRDINAPAPARHPLSRFDDND